MQLLKKIENGEVYTIAEMSANHGGGLENALKIAKSAKESGADCLKIQTYTADTMTIDCDGEYFRLKGGLWDSYKLYDLYKQAYTPWEWQGKIKEECEKLGMDFLSTPFDKTSADFLESLNVGAYKIASFELVDIPLISYVAKKGKHMIVSVGMGTIEEIQDAVDAMLENGLSKEQIILLQCTSSYPATLEEANLANIKDLQTRFGVRVGLSDHTMGSLVPIAAVALGACVVEKHFCLSRGFKTADSEFSMEPAEFEEMVKAVQNTTKTLGKVFYGVKGRERGNIIFRRSIFAVKDIKAGEVFTNENIRVIRPGQGIAPKYFSKLLGKASVCDYKRGEPIGKEEI